MTRKDYIKFAEILANAKPSSVEAFAEAEEMRQELAQEMVKIFEADNPSFDKGRFYQAADI